MHNEWYLLRLALQNIIYIDVTVILTLQKDNI